MAKRHHTQTDETGASMNSMSEKAYMYTQGYMADVLLSDTCIHNSNLFFSHCYTLKQVAAPR